MQWALHKVKNDDGCCQQYLKLQWSEQVAATTRRTKGWIPRIQVRIQIVNRKKKIWYWMSETPSITRPRQNVLLIQNGRTVRYSYFSAERPRWPIPTCFWRISCVSRKYDRSAAGIGIRSIGSLAFIGFWRSESRVYRTIHWCLSAHRIQATNIFEIVFLLLAWCGCQFSNMVQR